MMCITVSAIAQIPSEEYPAVREDLNDIFMNLDKTKVPTGLLLDFAVDLVDFSDYNGLELTENNLVDIPTYQSILHSIHSAGVINKPFGRVENIMGMFQSYTSEVLISLSAFKYNYIKANALEDNLLAYNESTGRVSDVYIDNIWQNPYAESKIFVSSPNCRSKRFLFTVYKFSPGFIFTNLDIAEIYFDAGDNKGYRRIQNTTKLPVNYSSPGIKELKLKIVTSDGEQFMSHSTIEIGTLMTAAYGRSVERVPDHKDSVFTHWDEDYDNDSTGTKVGAHISYYFKHGSSSFTKPFIVVEGFDPWIFNYMTGKLPDRIELGYTNYSSFYAKNWKDYPISSECDLVYIDWGNSIEDIRANAKLLKCIIRKINEFKATYGSTEPNVIMGQSMGGLVARYALRKMEIEAENHETSTYISHDSPHLGANVPLGALYFILQVLSFAHNYDELIDIYDLFTDEQLSTAESRLLSVLYGDSVNQMLYDTPIGNGSVHNGWQQELSILGFPNKTENIAIVNGRQFNRLQTMPFNSLLLHIDGYAQSSFLTSFLLQGLKSIIYSRPRVNIHAEVAPLSHASIGRPLSLLHVDYTKKFLWIFPKTYTIFHSSVTSPTSGPYYDDYPGSIYSIKDTNDIITVTFPEGITDNPWGDARIDIKLCNKFMFIPTASTLAINYKGAPNESDYTRDYFTNPPIPEIETPFDSYFLSEESSEHISIDNSMYQWVSNQLTSYIEGPDTLMSESAVYSANGFNGPVQWSCSDNTVAAIDNNGKLTATGNGMVKISAESYNNGKLIRKTKNVMVGFPEVAITYGFSPGSGHMFAVSTLNGEELSGLQEIVNKGYLRYEWSILCDEEDIVTTISSTPSISYLPKNDETVTVCMRLIDNNGNKGETYSRTVNLKNPFSTNYQYVEVNQNGNVKFIKANGYETGVPSENFTVTFRNIIYTPSDSALALAQKYLKGTNCYLAYSTSLGTVYMPGTKNGVQLQWRYTFLQDTMFLTTLEEVIDNATAGRLVSGEMTDFGLYICNHNRQIMQALPFVILYNPE